MGQGCYLRVGATMGLSASLCLLAGCARDPVGLIPDGPRSVLEHEVQYASDDHRPISVGQLLAQARGEAAASADATSSEADTSAAAGSAAMPAAAPGDLASSDAVTGQGPSADRSRPPSPAAANLEAVSLEFVDDGSDPNRSDAVDGARLRAVIDRLPPSVEWRAQVSIGPAPSGDPVVGLAQAQRRARELARMLPERLQPAQLRYRPDLPAGAMTVEFRPGGWTGDG
jgi:hypothetical protein